MRVWLVVLAVGLVPGPVRAAPHGSPTITAGVDAASPVPQGLAEGIFASGCFWCVEHDLEKVPGVVSVTSGYTGGHLRHPTYERVTREATGHLEAVRVVYDPRRLSYEQLLDAWWRTVDPFDATGQFCDRGPSYRPAVFVVDAAQREAAEASKRAVEARLGRPVVVPVRDADVFWVAEAYHQDYAARNGVTYAYYRWRCGRDARLAEVWGR